MLALERAPSISAILLIGACARETAPAAPPKYPALPKVADGGQGQFLPDVSLTVAQLACGSSELPDNGVDDDCDGVIDSAKGDASELTITAIQRAEAAGEVRLDLTAEGGGTVPDQATQRSTSRGAAVTVSRLDVSALSRGRYRLTASRQGAEPEATELFLAVSLATKGASHAYLVRLGAAEARTLGVIEVP